MGWQSWKQIEQGELAWTLKRFYKRLVGKELWLSVDAKISAVELGGWAILPDHLSADSIVYSMGVGDDLGFDFEVIERFGCEVHAFDPTPTTTQWVREQSMPDSLIFHPWAVAATDGALAFYPRVRGDGSLSDMMYTLVPETASESHVIEVPAFSLPTIMRRLEHDRIDLLKIDIEGAEFDVLAAAVALDSPPVQIVVEFHHRFSNIDIAHTRASIDQLRQSGYLLFDISKTGRELSFVRADQLGNQLG